MEVLKARVIEELTLLVGTEDISRIQALTNLLALLLLRDK